MTYTGMRIVQVGDEPNILYPSIDESLQIIPEAADGPLAIPFQASSVSVRRKVGNNWVKQFSVSDVSIQLWVTGSRVLLYCRNYDKGGGWVGFNLSGLAVAVTANAISKGMAANRRKGKALAGGVRYPWITRVSFSPRNGYGTRETLELEYVDATDSTKPACSLIVHLDNRTDSNALARFIADKIVAYRYASGETFTADEVAKFENLRTSGLRERPKKGFMGVYSVPTSFKVPHGLKEQLTSMPEFPARTVTAAEPLVAVPVTASVDVTSAPKFCTSCGSQFVGTAFCTDCGTPVEAA